MIFRAIGIGLVILGGLSGMVLFGKAVIAKHENFGGKGTLWGLFILGLVGGIVVLVSTR